MIDSETTPSKQNREPSPFGPAVELAARKVAHAATDAMTTATRTAQRNPWAAAGIILGSGVLLGALAYRLFAPRPTARALVMKAVRDGLAAGIHSARHMVE